MLLRHRVNDYRGWLGIGQFLLLLGILGQRLTKPGHMGDWIGLRNLSSTWVGFIEGMAFAFVVTSILFNLRGLMLYRQHRQEK